MALREGMTLVDATLFFPAVPFERPMEMITGFRSKALGTASVSLEDEEEEEDDDDDDDEEEEEEVVSFSKGSGGLNRSKGGLRVASNLKYWPSTAW